MDCGWNFDEIGGAPEESGAFLIPGLVDSMVRAFYTGHYFAVFDGVQLGVEQGVGVRK